MENENGGLPAVGEQSRETVKKPKSIPLPNAKKWLDARKRSLKARKHFLEDSERFWRMYQGDYSESPTRKRNAYRDRVSVNFIYSHIETITPAVFSGFPYIKVRAKPKIGIPPSLAEASARNMELVINYWFKELATDEELRDVFFDTFFGMATVELGWETVIKELEQEQQTENDTLEMLPPVIKLIDKPFIMRRELKSVFLDPDAHRRKDCRWIGVDEIMKWNDFLSDPRYTERAKQKLKPTYYPIDEVEKDYRDYQDRSEERSEKEWVLISTIWDKDSRKVYAVAEGYDGFVNSEDGTGIDWPYEIDYKSDPFPFCIHDGKRDRCSPYTWSEFKAGEPQILELNRIRAAISVQVRKTIPKYIYTDAAGTRTDINKLMNAKTTEATKLNNLDAFRVLETAEIPKPLFDFNNISRDDLVNVMGTQQFENGGFADTATEAQISEGKDRARKSMRSTQWEQFVCEIAGKLGQLCQQNMSDALAIEIAGPNGLEWLNVTKEEIQGEFTYDIEPGIMEYKNESIRKQQLLKFYEISRGDVNANTRGILTSLAQEFELNPEQVITAEEALPQGEPPEPNIQFKDIDLANITDQMVKTEVVIAAMKQNGVELPPEKEAALLSSASSSSAMDAPSANAGAPPALPMDGGGLPGKDLAGGLNPNGNEALPPVSGNIGEFGGLQ